MSLFGVALRNNWDAQKANPANLVMGAAGMIANNAFLVFGLYIMLFSGKAENDIYKGYFWAAQFMTMIAWGALNFFTGGFRELGRMIEGGSFEGYLATPRHSLTVAGFSSSDVTAVGDLVFGLIGNIALIAMFDFNFAVRTAAATLICTIAMLATFIFSGAIAFFVKRGAALGELLYYMTLSLSVYPAPAILTGNSRIMLYVTPALASALLPMEAVIFASAEKFVWAVVAAFAFLGLSVLLFNLGMRRYQGSSYFFMRE